MEVLLVSPTGIGDPSGVRDLDVGTPGAGPGKVLPDVKVLQVVEVFSREPEGVKSGVNALLIEEIVYPESRYGLFSAGCGGVSVASGRLF